MDIKETECKIYNKENLSTEYKKNIKKHFISSIIISFILIFICAGYVQADFVQSGGNTLYQTSNGKYATGLQKINGQYYYFDTSGILQKNRWIKTPEKKEYYASENGVLLRNQWKKKGKKLFYLKDNGEKAKGLTNVEGKLYYFSPKNGKKITGKIKDEKGNLYITNKKGVVYCGRFFKQKKIKYYANLDGTLARGLKKIGNDYYFFKLTSGKMITNKKKKVGNDTYYFTSTGVAARETWILVKGKYYYFQADGRMAKNKLIDKNWYVGEDGVRVKASQAPKEKIAEQQKTNGTSVVEYAKKFLGLPYVWGGTSLKTGADCSGFCQSVYNTFGILIMRVADDQMKGPTSNYINWGYKQGTQIQDANLLPGDLVFYDSSKDGVADHVAMYIGENKVIHEAGKKWGCIISDIDWAHGRVKNRNMRYWA